MRAIHYKNNLQTLRLRIINMVKHKHGVHKGCRDRWTISFLVIFHKVSTVVERNTGRNGISLVSLKLQNQFKNT